MFLKVEAHTFVFSARLELLRLLLFLPPLPVPFLAPFPPRLRGLGAGARAADAVLLKPLPRLHSR